MNVAIALTNLPQKPEVAIVQPSDKTIHSIQIYDELPPQSRPRKPLANWTSVRLGNNSDRPIVGDIAHGCFQWNMLNDNNKHGHGQRHNRPSEDTESVGKPIYLDDDSSTPGLGSEDVE